LMGPLRRAGSPEALDADGGVVSAGAGCVGAGAGDALGSGAGFMMRSSQAQPDSTESASTAVLNCRLSFKRNGKRIGQFVSQLTGKRCGGRFEAKSIVIMIRS
jgi:hypothetical protein